MPRRFLWAGTLAALAALAVLGGTAAAAARSSATGMCSTHGLRFQAHGKPAAGYSVVALRAHGVPCTKARSVATRVAQDLLHGNGISISGAVSFGMTEESCTGCGGTTTSVSIAYPHGQVTVSLRGSGSGSGSGGTATIPMPTLPGPSEPPGQAI